MQLSGRVALITGAGSGIGKAAAQLLAKEGARVAALSRTDDELEETIEEIREAGGEAIPVVADISEVEEMQDAIRKVVDEWGRLDIVFANAGFGAQRGFTAGDVDHWRTMVLTNVYGAALTIRARIDHLRESTGHLLLTGSVAGRRALPGSLYSATKWAVTAMGEAARQELNGSGVRVTLIEPGMVDTPFFDNRVTGALEADDIARAVMYAVSQPPHVDVNEILVRPVAQQA